MGELCLWTITGNAPAVNNSRMVTVRCICGVERVVRLSCIKRGKSLGCNACRSNRVTHGLTRGGRHPSEYNIWSSMRARCGNLCHPAYQAYGGRGIRVCARWESSFEAFVADMGPRPSPAHSIDRIDNSAGYEPGNCRWATAKEQALNTRRARFIEANGLRLCLSDWARVSGISQPTISNRLKNGWAEAEAVTVPVGQRRRQ